MADRKIVETGVWTLGESAELSYLRIMPGAEVSAVHGKTVTMTIDGVGQRLLPGEYEGDIRLTVADSIVIPYFALPEPHNFRAGIYIKDGKHIPEKSVPAIVRGGEVTDTRASGVEMSGYDTSFNGIFVDGDSRYDISDVRIDFRGNGDNDFVGFGACLMAYGSSEVTIDNTDIRVKGVTRNTLYVGQNSVATVKNSRLVSETTNELPQGYTECMSLGKMKRIPWVMGLRGTCRATNLADNGTVSFINCYLASDCWGVLSVDGADHVRMFVKDCTIETLGPSGYGAFSIGDSFDTFDNCNFNVATYALVMSNDNSGGEFTNGSVVSSKYGVIIFRNYKGLLKMNGGSVFNTKKTCIIAKGTCSTIEADNVTLNPGNGIILQLMDNDEQSNCLAWYKEPIGEVDEYIEGRDLTAANPDEDVFASFSNMEMTGDIFNSTTNLKANCRAPSDEEMDALFAGDGVHEPPPMPRGWGDDLQGAKNLDLKLSNVKYRGRITASRAIHNVLYIDINNCEELSEVNNTPLEPINNGVILRLDSGCEWTLTGSCYLTSLTIAEGAVMRADSGKTLTMTVDGIKTPVAAGKYTGKIALLAE